MNKIIFMLLIPLLMISLVSAVDTREVLNFTTNTTESSSTYNGAIVNVSTPIVLTYLIKMPSDGATRCLISDNGTNILASSTTFAGNYCQINYQLNANTQYYLLFDNQGISYTRQRALASNIPQGTGTINWLVGTEAGTNTSNSRSIWGANFTNAPNILDVTLDSPSNGGVFSFTNTTFEAIVETFGGYNLTNATTYVWFSNGTLFNKTTDTITGTSNSSSRNIESFTPDTYLWNVLFCGTNISSTQCSFATTNFSFIIQSFQVVNQTYTQSLYETESSTYTINLDVGTFTTSIFSALLNYSGTFYSATINSLDSSTYQITRTIDIPSIQTQKNNSFNWVINFEQLGTFTTEVTTQQTQQINDTNITSSAGLINFTIRDEETLELVNANFKNAFNWYLGTGTTTENASFNRGINNNFRFTTIPSFKNFTSNTFIELENGTYNPRIFDFIQETYGQTNNNKELLLLSKNNGTQVNIELKDSGLVAIPNYLIQIYRYYPATDQYRLVESRKTDLFGQISARIIEENVKYRILFFDEEENLVKAENNVYFICKSVICSTQFIISNDANLFDQFSNLTNYEYSLSYNNNTNVFTFVWNDQIGKSSTHRLEVRRNLFNGTTYVCNTNSTTSIGILSCDVGEERATYTAQAYRLSEGKEKRIALLSVSVGSLSNAFGMEGLIWHLLLATLLIGIGAFYPPAGVVLYLVSVLLLGLMDIIYINPGIIIAELVIGVLFIWAFR